MLRTHRYRMRGWSAMGEWKRVLRCDCILLRCKPREFDFFVSSELRLSNMCPFFLYFWCWRFAKWNLLFLLLRRKTHKEARSNWAMLSRLSYAPCPLRALCKCWSQSSANHVALPGATLLLTTLHHFFFPFVTHEFASVLLKTAVLLLLYHKLVFFPTLHQSHCNRLFPPLLNSSPASSTFFWTLSIGVLIAFLFFFFKFEYSAFTVAFAYYNHWCYFFWVSFVVNYESLTAFFSVFLLFRISKWGLLSLSHRAKINTCQ